MKARYLDMFSKEDLKKWLVEQKRIQKHNENILMSVFKICLVKKLTFECVPTLSLVVVRDQESSFRYDSYYEGNLLGYDCGDTIPLDKMLELVKKYKQ